MSKQMILLNDDWLIREDPEDMGKKNGFAVSAQGINVDLPFPSPVGGNETGPVLLENTDKGVKRPSLRPDLLFAHSRGPVWYYRKLETFPDRDENDRIFLHIDSADYAAEVYLNGSLVGIHENAECAFSLDITDFITGCDDLLCIRVISPVCGYNYEGCPSIKEMPNSGRSYAYYTFYSSCALYANVWLETVCAPFIRDAFITADVQTGKVCARIDLSEATGETSSAVFGIYYNDRLIAETEDSVNGEKAELSAFVSKPMLWSPEEPNLYTATIRVTQGNKTSSKVMRFGFRSLIVHDGYFYLNGERIFLKCAHAGLETKQRIAQAKAMGFQMLRFLSRLPDERILSYCDEIGMMVYAECAVSWGMTDYDKTEEHMQAYLSNMFRCCRNHVSVCMYGIFNETGGGNPRLTPEHLPSTRVVDYAISHLETFRMEDPTRIILLSSGRWDARIGIGSFSNPGSNTWEYQWGEEAPKRSGLAGSCSVEYDPYVMGMGDNHIYPYVPLAQNAISFIKNIGASSKPVFLSEYGVGSQLYLPEMKRFFYETGLHEHRSAKYYAKQEEVLHDFVKKYDMEELYQCPEDFLLASIRLAAVQRIRSMDPVRGNAHICGYSMTSFGTSNEGVYFAHDRYMPGIVEALHDSFASLRWCIFVKKRVIFAGEKLELSLSLATEKYLKTGEHRVSLAIRGRNGIVLRKTYDFVYPESSPMAIDIFTDAYSIEQAGEYTVSLMLDGLRQPTCGETTVFVMPPVSSLDGITVGGCGEMEQVYRFLEEKKVTFRGMEKGLRLYLIGDKTSKEEKEQAMDFAREGATVIMLSPGFWDERTEEDKGFMSKMTTPDGKNQLVGKKVRIRNWLYHMDCYAKESPLMDGLWNSGILDMDLFGTVHPTEYMVDSVKPAVTHCAAFGTGMFTENGCMSGLVLGEIPCERGKIVINTFQILPNVFTNPVAQRILYNLISHFSE